jgi:hypothetical protein
MKGLWLSNELPPFLINSLIPFESSFYSQSFYNFLSFSLKGDSLSIISSKNYIIPFLLNLIPKSISNLFLFYENSMISSSLSSGKSHAK